MVDPSYDPDGVDPSDSESDSDDSELLAAYEALAEHRIPTMNYEAQQALLTDLIGEIVSNPSDPSDVHDLMTAEHLFSLTPDVRAGSLAVALRRKLDRLRAMNTTTTPLMRETQWRITHWALMSQLLHARSMMYQQFLQQENE
jgi:hypothetical protein